MDILLERDVWAKQVEDNPEAPPALRKGMADIIKGVDVENRTVETIISTGAVDRDGDTIDPKKWDLKHYKKNPIVLFGHDHRQIVGNSKVTVKDGKLVSVDQFVPEDFGSGIANLTFNLVAGGFMKAKSVGFKPHRGKFEYVEDDERRGYDFHGQELLEHSYVAVPSNPEALVGAKAAGITLSPLIEWAKQILDESEETFLYLPRETVERVLKIAEGDPTRITVPVDIEIESEILDAMKDLEDGAVISFEKRDDSLKIVKREHTDLDLNGIPDLAEGEVAEIEGFFDSEGHMIVVSTEYGKGIHVKRSENQPDPKEPADEDVVKEALVALLDSSEPANKDEPLSEDELKFAAEKMAQQLSGHIREAVATRLTALTGKLD